MVDGQIMSFSFFPPHSLLVSRWRRPELTFFLLVLTGGAGRRDFAQSCVFFLSAYSILVYLAEKNRAQDLHPPPSFIHFPPPLSGEGSYDADYV